MTRPQIAPCRACGSPRVNVYRNIARPSFAFVMCDDCGYRGRSDRQGCATVAIHLWNREAGLKPCPFCNSLPDVVDVGPEMMEVRCPECGIKTSAGSLEEITKAWNCRHQEVD